MDGSGERGGAPGAGRGGPHPVALARALIAVGGAFGVVAALGCAVLGLVALSFTGAAVRSSGGPTRGELVDLASLFGTVVAVVFAFWTVVLALGAWLTFRVAAAVRRGSRRGRMVATVLVGLVLLAVSPVVLGAVDGPTSAAALLLGAVLLSLPPTVVVLLWIPAPSRRHFGDAVHEPLPVRPAPPTSPVPLGAPPGALPPGEVRCAACGIDVAPHDRQCGVCGLPLAAAAEPRPVEHSGCSVVHPNTRRPEPGGGVRSGRSTPRRPTRPSPRTPAPTQWASVTDADPPRTTQPVDHPHA